MCRRENVAVPFIHSSSERKLTSIDASPSTYSLSSRNGIPLMTTAMMTDNAFKRNAMTTSTFTHRKARRFYRAFRHHVRRNMLCEFSGCYTTVDTALCALTSLLEEIMKKTHYRRPILNCRYNNALKNVTAL